jgi:hypothetical protein
MLLSGPMTLGFRHTLIWIVAALWVAGTCRFVLGARSVQEMTWPSFWDRVRSQVSDGDVLMWFAMLLATMFVADRLLCWYANWRYGIDPMKVHWSRLRNREGDFLCAACLGPFMLPPEDMRDTSFVHCGDCGHAVAPYGEMKPYFPERIAAWEARALTRITAGSATMPSPRGASTISWPRW